MPLRIATKSAAEKSVADAVEAEAGAVARGAVREIGIGATSGGITAIDGAGVVIVARERGGARLACAARTEIAHGACVAVVARRGVGRINTGSGGHIA